MKTNPVQERSLMPGDDFIVIPEPQTAINISSMDTMNITISKCCLAVFSNLAKVTPTGRRCSIMCFHRKFWLFFVYIGCQSMAVLQLWQMLPGRAEEFYSDDSFRLNKKVVLSFERSNFCVRTTNVPMQDLRKCHMCRLNEHEML